MKYLAYLLLIAFAIAAVRIAILLSVKLRRANDEIRRLKRQSRTPHPFVSSRESEGKTGLSDTTASPQSASAASPQRDAKEGHSPAMLAPPSAESPEEAVPGRMATVELNSPPSEIDLYRAWCRGGPRPRSNDSLEFVFVRYGRGEQSARIGGNSTHLVVDAAQAAEFVRFGKPGALEASLRPTPTAHYTPVMAYVFPGLTRDLFTPQYLESLKPSRIRRRDGGEWEVVDA